jgi:hypothetical protein
MRFVPLAILFPLLGACTAFTAVPLLGMQGGFPLATGKTMTDTVTSWSSGKNCSQTRIDQGLTYCVEDEKNIPPRVYCYKSLGGATCYAQPDPYRDGRDFIGDNSTNLP